MHKVFVSHHNKRDGHYKDILAEVAKQHSIFIDASVDTNDIPDEYDDEYIRKIIRDDYLRDSTVTIVLVGTETKHRKHVDWEIHSSMYDGPTNKKSGILVINLPSISNGHHSAAFGDEEKKLIYPDTASWVSVETRSEYERRYPYMPERIIDNLLKSKVTISVAPWDRINVATLKFLIDSTYQNRSNCKYDLSRPMRRANS